MTELQTPVFDYGEKPLASAKMNLLRDDIRTAMNLADAASVFTPAGTDAVTRTVEAKLREQTSVRNFGAEGDDATDDTDAFQRAVDYAGTVYKTIGRTADVYMPPGIYRISGDVTVPSHVLVYGDDNPEGSSVCVIRHTDPTKSLFKLGGRACVADVRIQVDNTDRVTPIASPPTITNNGFASYPAVKNVRFENAYIGVGSDGVNNNAWVVEGLWGFVHHAMVSLSLTQDISYLRRLHSQNPDGVSWDASWYAYSNKVLVRLNDCDGVYGSDWFSFAGRGLFSAAGNQLLVAVNNFGIENCTQGVELAADATNSQGFYFTGGYLQANGRTDAVALYTVLGNSQVTFTNTAFSATAKEMLSIQGGNTRAIGCDFKGQPGSTAIRKYTGGKITVEASRVASCSTVILLETGADGVFFGASNEVVTGGGVFLSGVPGGYSDITEPVSYVTTGANIQQTLIRRRTPASTRQEDVLDEFRVHQHATQAVGGGASLVATASNTNGAHVPGSRVKLKAYNTDGTPGAEAARVLIFPYTAGDYGVPFEVWEDGSVRVMQGGHISSGTGTPESVVTAPVGSLFLRTDGGATTTLYVKTSGAGNTGWTAK